MTAARLFLVVDIAVTYANKSQLLQTIRHTSGSYGNDGVVLLLCVLNITDGFSDVICVDVSASFTLSTFLRESNQDFIPVGF